MQEIEKKDISSRKPEREDLRPEIELLDADNVLPRALSDEDEMDVQPEPGAAESPEELYERLQNNILRYHPSDDMSMIRKAYELAREAHKDQKRHSGEPYIIHPLHVALILADMQMDKESIVAGLLHDVVEDTDTDLDTIRSEFGDDVALLVDGVTKLTRISFGDVDKLEMQAENLRKMFLSMSKDIRIIIIKLSVKVQISPEVLSDQCV